MINKDYFLAKSNKIKNGEFITQTIEEHTNKLIELFNKFKDVYGNYFEEHELELIKIACETHDLGKMNSRFQKKLYNSINREKYFDTNKELNALYEQLNITEIPHGVLSCSFLDIGKLKKEFDTVYIKALASAIYNHHERKVVDNNGIDLEDNKIKKIVESDLFKYYKLYNENLKCNFRGISNNEIKKGVDNDYEFWLKFIVIKGMLNKIDYAASAGLDTLELTPDDASKYVENAFKIKKEKDKNITFPNEVQEFMGKEENKDKNIIVVASTGIGKTEGALLWAGDSKTFYTLPIKVSINAIYKRIWDENYYDKNKFTFLHSDAKSIMRKDEEIDDYQLKYIETRHLIYPLTICTVDQLFYFVFKSLGTEKYAATLKYSKIIIDEIQSYTPDIISFLIFGFKVVNDLGGKFCIMTATLPPIVKYFLEETIGKENIKIAEKPFYKKDNEENIIIRHKIKYEEKDFEYNEILEKAKNNKVLIICNTVRRSQDVYIKLKEKNKQNTEINLLHSRFIFRDRKLKEEKIQEFASTKEEKRNNDAGIWISTQIVEASLDIDFDVLYTDMCSADSLLQRMGRCYRNRIYEKDEPNIFIYDTKIGVGNGKNSVYDLDIYDRSVKFIKEYDNNIFTEEQKLKYIDKVYNTKDLENSDYLESINKNYEALKNLSPAFIEKSQATDLFRAIDSVTVMPKEKYLSKNVNNIINEYFEIKNKENKTKEDFKNMILKKNEILGFTTSVRLYKKDKSNTGIKPLELGKNKFEKIFIVDLEYSEELGLLDNDANIFLSD